MEDKFTEIYNQIITESNEDIALESWLGTTWNKVKNAGNRIKGTFTLKGERAKQENLDNFKTRFIEFFKRSGFKQLAKDNPLMFYKNIEGSTYAYKFNSGTGELEVYTKIGSGNTINNYEVKDKMPLNIASDEDGIHAAVNKLCGKNSLPVPDFKYADEQPAKPAETKQAPADKPAPERADNSLEQLKQQLQKLDKDRDNLRKKIKRLELKATSTTP